VSAEGLTPKPEGRCGCVLVVGPGCRSTRLALDPAAWIVLEELVLAAEIVDGLMATATSVRALGESLGMSKDAVAAALRRLTGCGLVRREDQRDRSSGFFSRSRYVVTLEGTGLTTQPCPGSETPPEPNPNPKPVPDLVAVPAGSGLGRGRRSAGRVVDDGQLSLLDVGGDEQR